MKIALILALARYFHRLPFHNIGKPTRLIVPLLLIAAPAALILKQPDLGTAGLIGVIGVAMLFLAGVRMWKFAVVFGVAAVALPFAWTSLHSYQQERLLAFINPESDPLGSGYHIIQSKIALGSGGLTGKGFLEGTQIHLDFLPEIHTDFIFSVLAEEFGLLGGVALLGLYVLILAALLFAAFRCKHAFGRLFATGFAFALFLHVFVNLAMVMGLIPVVGVPLPLVSYGGTFLFAVMLGFGLFASIYRSRGERIGRHDEEEF